MKMTIMRMLSTSGPLFQRVHPVHFKGLSFSALEFALFKVDGGWGSQRSCVAEGAGSGKVDEAEIIIANHSDRP